MWFVYASVRTGDKVPGSINNPAVLGSERGCGIARTDRLEGWLSLLLNRDLFFTAKLAQVVSGRRRDCRSSAKENAANQKHTLREKPTRLAGLLTRCWWVKHGLLVYRHDRAAICDTDDSPV